MIIFFKKDPGIKIFFFYSGTGFASTLVPQGSIGAITDSPSFSQVRIKNK